jgi:hypothetical protein
MRVKLRKRAPRLAAALGHLEHDSSELVETVVETKRLSPGMLINADVHDKLGVLLVSKGQEVSETLVRRLQTLARAGAIEDRLTVLRGAALPAATEAS